VVIARELTKIHEEFIRGTARSVRAHLETTPPLGEVVILFDARKNADPEEPGEEEPS